MTEHAATTTLTTTLATRIVLTATWQHEQPDPVWARTALQSLTRRELQILEMLAAWWTSREIADALCISYRTVTTHVTHIYDKLGVNSRRQAVTFLLVVGQHGD